MRSILNTIFVSVLLLAATACNSDKSPLDPFSQMQAPVLHGESIKLQSDSILYKPYNFQVFDTLGVFNDNIGPSGLVVISLKNGTLVKRFAFSGDKPSEFDLNGISFNSVANSKTALTVSQSNQPGKIILYNWSDLLSKPIYKPEPLYYIKSYGYRNSFLLNDSILFGQFTYSKFDDKMFGFTNIKSNKLITGLDVPRISDASQSYYYDDPMYYKLMKGMLDMRVKHRPGSKHEFAAFSHLGAVIQIFESDENYKFKVKYEKAYYIPSFSVESAPNYLRPKMSPGRKYGFNDIAVTKDEIYTLFNGPELTKPNTFSDDILVYDWNGKPLRRFKLDRKCRNIALDESNPNFLYALYGEEDVQIVRYKLP
jgi:hypothetical protein